MAVTLGGLLAKLPRTPVEVVAALLFLVGGILLLRGASHADEEEAETEEEFSHKGAATAHGLKVVGTSFAVLFLAEWGDLSQLLTASMVIKYDDPLSVGVGAFAALAAVSGWAPSSSRCCWARSGSRRSAHRRHRVCLALALVSALQIAEVIGG